LDIGRTQTIIGLAAPLVIDDGRIYSHVFVYLSYELPFAR
jgi:hypothetical protein